jgi:hypothetical protein
MKIQLKNIKYSEWVSEETACYQANIYLNGKHVGYCSNDGKGGCTSYNRIPNVDYKVIQAMEEYCKGLPPIEYDSNIRKGSKFTINMTLEHYLDDLLTEYLKAKDEAKLTKKMDKAILIGNEYSYQIIGFKVPLKEVWEKQPQYFAKTLNDSLNKYATNGRKLLNTNIPLQFITN